MVRIKIEISAPSEELLRRAMDEIVDAEVRCEREAQAYEVTGGGEMTARRGRELAKRKRDVARVLHDIGDAIDHAEPRKVV